MPINEKALDEAAKSKTPMDRNIAWRELCLEAPRMMVVITELEAENAALKKWCEALDITNKDACNDVIKACELSKFYREKHDTLKAAAMGLREATKRIPFQNSQEFSDACSNFDKLIGG